MRKNIRQWFVMFLVTLLVSILTGCGNSNNAENRVVIYTSAEDYRVDYMRQRMEREFPDYEIVIEYMSTGDHAAKLLAEGLSTEADITYDLEYGYLEQLEATGILANLDGWYDQSIYVPEAINSTFYLPVYKNSGAIIVNPAVLNREGLPVPTSYEDLCKPQYKNLISMPNPQTSGTGYMFLKSLVNAWGEEEAFAYFEAFSANVLQYTSSGSGPVNALIQEEVAIGLGMTGQAVTAINKGTDLQILYFEEGSPYTMYGQGIINGKESRPCVKEVFDFLIHTFSEENCANFYPEQIYTDRTFEIENYPNVIPYADMQGNTAKEKTHLLEQWFH